MVRLESGNLLFRGHGPADLEPFCAIESGPVYRVNRTLGFRLVRRGEGDGNR